MKYIKLLSGLILFYTSTTSAGPPNSLQSDILMHSHNSQNGVIVAITDSGDIAVETAWLLSAQVKMNNTYAPMLLVLKQEERESTLSALKLTMYSLPALIYYDRHGNEISRVIGAMPTYQLKQVRSKSIEDVL